ncbi:glycosyltransferase family 9 protein [Mycolicibacterium litorale]|uniref:Glycosyl transferase n=1 Tax=Mycolicibacterium litorale TaxID=758802 RepID=A0AAD1MSH6_9MYCO|nr:glycosyltransferase family 9 protein [Mycolicibacterium litorale]MCV7416083.1 glycosyltransferase family 9 protein [Mycolicibacterium litorale]TDY09334.1 ADP-heptose:LPS heptosyltransferase [Mycolicibacterium litorale]BBY17279.1 glycosyl transferase [Mycolicibacterium litorale]
MALSDTAAPDTILVLRALGLGDLLTGVPALRGLRRAHPDAHIVLAAPERFGELALLTGAVDAVQPTAGLGRLRPLHTPPVLAVNLHGSGPESISDLLGLGARSILTHRHDAFPQLQGPAWPTDVHEVDRWCGLLEWAGIPCERADLTIPRPPGCPDRSGVTVIHPGAAFPARRWPPERFAAVAAALYADGHDVVITGDAGEVDLARTVAAQAGLPGSAVLAGTLGLLDLVALISDCRLLVCGDTGVGHIATATGTPSVLLFGPTPPSLWGPRGTGPHAVLWAGRDGDPHGDAPDPGLLALTVSAVLGAVDALRKEPV